MTDLKNLKKQNRKFKITLLLSYLLFATLILVAIYLLHVKYSSNESIKNFQLETQEEASFKQNYFNNFFIKNKNVVTAVSQNEIFLDFVKEEKKEYKYVHSIFKTVMLSNSNYMQLRYIDKNGLEIIRLDRRNIADNPILVEKDKLQNKSQRYYFKECCNTKKNEIWNSKIDLNIEHNQIEKPIKPVIRIAQQVHLNNQFEGFIIINIFMKPYLKTLTESSIFDVYLSDHLGNFLIHKDENKNWSKYFNEQLNVSTDLNIDSKTLKASQEYFSEERKFFIQPLIYGEKNNYRLIYFENANKVINTQNTIKQRVMMTILFAIFIAVPFAYIASSPAKKIYQSLYQKSNDITELANNLEKRVEEEIEKNLKKDRMLENQSKLAALGEMIGNIAHQWRHPITRVSLILQNVKTFKSLGKLSDEQLNNYITKALDQTDYMSQTIDDFKDFYKPDNKVSNFSAKKAIGDAHKIIGASIKHQGIDITIDLKKDFLISGYKNQFAQVILNIMNNAREALEETSKEHPYIKIKLTNQNDANLITIEDNAGGIKIDTFNKIFDAYFTTKEDSGTGIGLYMSKMIIVENFHGKLYVKNTPQGALFSIELPIVNS